MPFTWGKLQRYAANKTRQQYIDSLKQADIGNYKPLLKFVRS